MRTVFMGTPDFALPTLRALINSRHSVAAVFTQPDRPKGRGKQIVSPPVKDMALAAGIPVHQPVSIKESTVVKEIKQMAPDAVVVVAYGQILPKTILELPEYGCINVHASLLPKYRGAAPIHWAVMNGEQETGVTTMFMNEGLDTGDIILQSRLAIGPTDTAGIVHDRLASLGADLLLETLDQLERGKAPRVPQDEAMASYAPMLTRDDEVIDWADRGDNIINKVRGLNPWPGAFTYYRGKILKIWQVSLDGGHFEHVQGQQPGTIVAVNLRRGFSVVCGHGKVVLVEKVQLQGKRQMSAPEFLRGYQLGVGEALGKKEVNK